MTLLSLKPSVVLLAAILAANANIAQSDALSDRVDQIIQRNDPAIVAVRRQIHQHPELGYQEVNTAKLVAERLRKLGLEVRTGVAKTGVIAVLKGGKPGPVVALRSELDALPIVEQTGLPYASEARAQWEGEDVGVMHACGHDAHIAILLGVAEALSAVRADLAGSVKFIFQPAEEGGPEGESGGALRMIAEGALENPRPEAIFSLHVGAGKSGSLSVKSGRTTAGADNFVIVVKGRQTHAGTPWRGVDPVPLAAQVILGLQTIPSRQLASPPPLITVSRLDAGFRWNIIAPEVTLRGTLRTLSPEQREDAIARIRRTSTKIAESADGRAEVTIVPGGHVVSGYNDPDLAAQVLPVLSAVAPEGKATVPVENSVAYVADDFAEFAALVPAVGFGLGVLPPDIDPGKAAGNHSPLFQVDDNALQVGVRAFSHIILNYFAGNISAQRKVAR